MSARFEETLIRHCAATLAGHKCGSHFSYRPQAGESLSENAADYRLSMVRVFYVPKRIISYFSGFA